LKFEVKNRKNRSKTVFFSLKTPSFAKVFSSTKFTLPFWAPPETPRSRPEVDPPGGSDRAHVWFNPFSRTGAL